ncbi:MAG: radical SAM family heme chaperone HemW [Cyclobacteriaceae bacterium]
MAGIYIHIPFCSQACHYCDFHFSTRLGNTDRMVDAIIKEAQLRADYLAGQAIETIYFGGGTPSIIPSSDLERILAEIFKNHSVSSEVEITLEGNPDDLSLSKLKELKDIGINRLSVGIQTFDEEALSFMNRSHSSTQARECLENIRKAEFANYTADLIFAVPPEKDSFHRFFNDLQELLTFRPPHVSLYGLTIEQKTVFGKWFDQEKILAVSEDENARQYELAIELLTDAGFDHYEVSNFGLPGKISRHNSSYWKGAWYLGLGPSAHSYNGLSRSINVPNNVKYLKAIEDSTPALETEILSDTQQLNEYILTGIRTKWGIDLGLIQKKWGLDFLSEHRSLIDALINDKKAMLTNDRFLLNSSGFSIADELALRFFSEE